MKYLIVEVESFREKLMCVEREPSAGAAARSCVGECQCGRVRRPRRNSS
jgi:hypothetical protein